MTITTLPTRNEYTATASQTVFTYTFKIFDEDEIKCYVTPAGQDPDDSTDEVTINVVTGVGDEDGGTIEIDPVSAGNLVTIVSDIAENRVTDYQVNGDFSAPVVNTDFDRVVSLVKQVSAEASRTLQFQEAQQNSSGLTLPVPSAGEFLRWTPAEDGLENYQQPPVLVENFVDTIAELRLYDTSALINGANIHVNGYYEQGDGGGGPVRYLSTGQAPGTYTDNNGTIIVPTGGDGSEAWLIPDTRKINVKWFGTKNNGVDDDAPYIDNAFSIYSSDAIYYIPPGTYQIDTSVGATFGENIVICAYGAKFECGNPNLLFTLGSSGDTSFAVQWFGGYFQNTGVTKTATYAISFVDTGKATVKDTAFKFFEKAIRLPSSTDSSVNVTNCLFDDCDYSFYSDLSGPIISINITNSFFQGDHKSHIYLERKNYSILIQGNYFSGGREEPGTPCNSIYMSNTDADEGINGISIISNYFKDGIAGDKYIEFNADFGAGSYAFRGVNLLGNTFKGTAPDAVDVENCDGFEYSGNTFEQTTGTPISFSSNCEWIYQGANYYTTSYPVYNSFIPNNKYTSFPTIIPTISSTVFNGSARSSGTTLIDLTSVSLFPNHAPVKGVHFLAQARDSASASTPSAAVYIRTPSLSQTLSHKIQVGGMPNDVYCHASGFVLQDSNQIEVEVVASGTDTMDVYIYIFQWVI